VALVGWVDPDDPRLIELWPDAAQLTVDTLTLLLTSAYEQVLAYAPVIPAGDPVPERYGHAQILHASEVFAASRRTGDVVGFEDTGLAIRVRPLTATVKALLRPRRGVPVLG
jgi:hypothetical protein